MTYTDRMTQIRTQHAYARDVANRGMSALLAPYTLARPVVPVQRRRFVRTEVAA